MAHRPVGGKAGAAWGCALPSPSPLEKEFIMESPCKQISRILILLTLLCVATLQPAFGQSFTVKDLGALPGGIFSVARGINEHGQVVGFSETNGLSQSHAFLFEHGAMVDLGTLPGAEFGEATGINNRGQVVGFSGRIVRFEFAVFFEDGVIVK